MVKKAAKKPQSNESKAEAVDVQRRTNKLLPKIANKTPSDDSQVDELFDSFRDLLRRCQKLHEEGLMGSYYAVCWSAESGVSLHLPAPDRPDR
jgi:hypothetical protein